MLTFAASNWGQIIIPIRREKVGTGVIRLAWKQAASSSLSSQSSEIFHFPACVTARLGMLIPQMQTLKSNPQHGDTKRWAR